MIGSAGKRPARRVCNLSAGGRKGAFTCAMACSYMKKDDVWLDVGLAASCSLLQPVEASCSLDPRAPERFGP